jgi:hypothetical protein
MVYHKSTTYEKMLNSLSLGLLGWLDQNCTWMIIILNICFSWKLNSIEKVPLNSYQSNIDKTKVDIQLLVSDSSKTCPCGHLY